MRQVIYRSISPGNSVLSPWPLDSVLRPGVLIGKTKTEKFEDLIAWQKARELTREIYNITGVGEFARDYGLRDQIRRAAVSIMSNIAEGFDRGGRSEFHQFVVIAKGSCAEVRSQLYVAEDTGYISKEKFNRLNDKTIELSRLLGGLRRALDKQRKCK